MFILVKVLKFSFTLLSISCLHGGGKVGRSTSRRWFRSQLTRVKAGSCNVFFIEFPQVCLFISHLKWSRICHTRQASCAASPWTPSPPCLRSPAHSEVTSLINDPSLVSSLSIFYKLYSTISRLGAGVCALGYLSDLCARFIGKSFTGAGSGSGLSPALPLWGRSSLLAAQLCPLPAPATQARQRAEAAPALAWTTRG